MHWLIPLLQNIGWALMTVMQNLIPELARAAYRNPVNADCMVGAPRVSTFIVGMFCASRGCRMYAGLRNERQMAETDRVASHMAQSFHKALFIGAAQRVMLTRGQDATRWPRHFQDDRRRVAARP